MTDVRFLHKNSCNNLTVCKQMRKSKKNNLYCLHIYTKLNCLN